MGKTDMETNETSDETQAGLSFLPRCSHSLGIKRDIVIDISQQIKKFYPKWNCTNRPIFAQNTVKKNRSKRKVENRKKANK